MTTAAEGSQQDDGTADDVKPLGVGVVGLGVMGAQHVESYRVANAVGAHNRLVAVCDPSEERRSGQLDGGGNLETDGAEPRRLFEPDQLSAYAKPEELLADEAVDVVSICTYTDSHVPLAIAALEAGKHVLVEKPIALRSADVAELVTVAARHGEQFCMPAMCIRFWPGWRWVRERVVDGSLGAVQSARFRRFAAAPNWGREFYGDATRSGGALTDLHVHDADFVRWVFGPPHAVETTGNPTQFSTRYIYDGDGPEVHADGAWVPDPKTPFYMGFRVAFEQGVADYAFGREPLLRLEVPGQRVQPIALPEGNGYDAEVTHLLKAIEAQRVVAEGGAPDANPFLDASLVEAVDLMAMIEAERESLESGARVGL